LADEEVRAGLGKVEGGEDVARLDPPGHLRLDLDPPDPAAHRDAVAILDPEALGVDEDEREVLVGGVAGFLIWEGGEVAAAAGAVEGRVVESRRSGAVGADRSLRSAPAEPPRLTPA
jgi:hypothetical protein